MPPRRGIFTSMIATSGRSPRARSTASTPSRASAHTAKPARSSISLRSRRMIVSSSATRMRSATARDRRLSAVSRCCTNPASKVFGKRQARRDARRYRRKGLDGTGRRLVDELAARGVEGSKVLEVGGGVGAVEIELLEAGAAGAVNVELSDGYEAEAGRLLDERGLAGRVERRLGDFVEGEFERADLVVLH